MTTPTTERVDESYSYAQRHSDLERDPSRAAGKLRIEGKDYIMHDSDVVHFLFNV